MCYVHSWPGSTGPLPTHALTPGFPLLSTLLATPFLIAVALFFVPGRARTAIHWLSMAGATVMLLLSIAVFLAFAPATGGFQLDEQYAWLPQLGITLHLATDGIAAPLVLLTGVVIFCGTLVSLKVTHRPKDYFILLFTLVGGVYGTFLSLDLFFLFFFYEIAVLPMYLLIGVWGSSTDFGTFLRTKEYGAMKLTLVLVAGSIPVWVAIIATFLQAGAGSMDLPVLAQATYSREFQLVFYPMFMIGFGILAGLFPFHTWSPDGHVAAPTAVSMLHAGVLMKLGAFGIIRVGMLLMPEGAAAWAPVLLVLATVNVVYGALSALGQTDLKYVIGYSSVSHMGYVLMGFASMSIVGVNGAVLQMVSHGIMTALFFTLVGVVYDQAHTRLIASFGGLAQQSKLVAVMFAIAGFASLGLPGLSGFVAEFLIFVGLFERYPLFGALGIAGAAITAVYILRLMATAFFGPANPKWATLHGPNRSETLAAVILCASIFAVGLFPSLLMPAISVGVASLMSTVLGAG